MAEEKKAVDVVDVENNSMNYEFCAACSRAYPSRTLRCLFKSLNKQCPLLEVANQIWGAFDIALDVSAVWVLLAVTSSANTHNSQV